MNRILIATRDRATIEASQNALANAGYQTAVVPAANQLIDFCRQHQPDLVVIDLELPGGSVWAAAKTLRNFPNTSAVPFVGLGNGLSDTEILHARSMGFSHFEPKPVNGQNLVGGIRSILQTEQVTQTEPRNQATAPNSSLPAHPVAGNTGDGNPVNKLRELINEILKLTENLKPRVSGFGPDGPELFGYIVGSGAEIDQRLNSIERAGPEASRQALLDHDTRHDFRNMIGSVTGFAELILMEPVVCDMDRPSLTRIRECSRIFVDLLDQQKAVAVT